MPPLAGKPYKDYYQILGVSPDVNDESLKAAYRDQALKYHPDSNPSPEAHQKFLDINEAYQVLSNREERRKYHNRYIAHQGPAKKGTGITERYERTKAKRQGRYGRSMYSQRIRYRGSSTSNPSRQRERSQTKNYSRSEFYNQKHVQDFVRQKESELKGFRYYSGVVRVFSFFLLLFSGGLILDYYLAIYSVPERVVAHKAVDWTITTPGMTRVQANYGSFLIPSTEAKLMPKGTTIRIKRSLMGRFPTHVFVRKGIKEYTFKTYGGIYGYGLPLLFILFALGMVTTLYRRNPEFNAYLGTFTILSAIIIFGILFKA